jgi:Xaa-Pro aminopeptidase
MTITSPSPVYEAERLNLPRMRQERYQKLQAEMERQDVDALVLLGSGNVQYATGAVSMLSDLGRALHLPTIAVVPRGAPAPHLYTPYPEGAPPELPAENVHGPLYPEFREGVQMMAAALREALGPRASGKIGFDAYSPPMFALLPELLPNAALIDAGNVLGAAKIMKTADEVECIRRAQRINELAMYDVQAALRPGVRQSELSGLFLRRIFELGASGNVVDPIWQPIPARLADGPFTVHGDLAFPLVTSDRILREGDVLMVDSGIVYQGYASDFGRTWIVGRDPRPTDKQRDMLKQWREVVDRVLDALRPGVTGRDLTRAALAGGPPKAWLSTSTSPTASAPRAPRCP